MEIEIMENQEETLRVVIKCHKINPNILRLKSHISLFDNTISAKKDNQTCFVNASDIFYFESVNNRTFLYMEQEVLETAYRLYELESILPDEDFIRISKSQILNIHKVQTLKPELNRTILATMCNGERLNISRKYVPVLRNLLLGNCETI